MMTKTLKSTGSISPRTTRFRLAGALIDLTARIWSLDTGELVAGPFKISAYDGYLVTLSF